jgi:signal transduction histidine kinase
MASCDLSALIREMTQELLLTASERVVSLDIPETSVMVMADTDRVGQVLTNYLTNALKYAPPERPISVMLRCDETMARVEVADQGPGLSLEQQSGLFERFYRAEGIETLSGSGVGLGLGLYISRMIVARHGGQVGIESAPGAGATFWFTLPLLAPQP